MIGAVMSCVVKMLANKISLLFVTRKLSLSKRPVSLHYNINKKRMHSSRMRTGRSLTVCWRLLPGGVSAPGGFCLPGGVWSGGVSAHRGVCSWGVSAPGGSVCPGGSAPGGVCSGGIWSGGVVSQHALRQTPSPAPVDRITDACKNITLAQLRCGW